MFPGLVLSLREGLEAALTIGIVLGVVQKMDRSDLKPVIWRGAVSAMILSLIAAIALNVVGAELEGKAEAIYEGITMLMAASILTWMIFWMRRQSRKLKQNIESEVRQKTAQNGQMGIFLLAFLGVLREGIELSIYLLAASLSSSTLQVVIGAALGLSAAALLGWMLFATSKRISLPKFFKATNVVMVVFAGGLIGLSLQAFNTAGWIPVIIPHVWNINAFLSDQSTLGEILKSLFGYRSNPSLSEVMGYFGYYVVLLVVIYFTRERSERRERKLARVDLPTKR
jgi:high-affinity iron transporter